MVTKVQVTGPVETGIWPVKPVAGIRITWETTVALAKEGIEDGKYALKIQNVGDDEVIEYELRALYLSASKKGARLHMETAEHASYDPPKPIHIGTLAPPIHFATDNNFFFLTEKMQYLLEFSRIIR